MQIYTNFESNSQPLLTVDVLKFRCFRCKFTQILKAIHNHSNPLSDIRGLFPMQIYTNFESNSQLREIVPPATAGCFRCKFTQILKAIHNYRQSTVPSSQVVSDANLHKF